MARKWFLSGAIVCTLLLVLTVSVGQAQGPALPLRSGQAGGGTEASMGTAFTYQGKLMDDGAVANGVYDFPQKDVRARLQSALLILLTKIPSMRKELYTKRIKTEMIKPLQKALEAGE